MIFHVLSSNKLSCPIDVYFQYAFKVNFEYLLVLLMPFYICKQSPSIKTTAITIQNYCQLKPVHILQLRKK